MKIHRFFVAALPAETEFELTDASLVRQIKIILSLKAGEQIDLCDGRGTVLCTRIVSYEKNTIRAAEISRTTEDAPTPRVTAFVSLLKRDNFELVVQKLTEIGIAKIVPIISAHTVKTALNMRRLETIAKEAAELSGRSYLPEILEPVTLAKALAIAPKNAAFFDISGAAGDAPQAPAFFIGPEGGWTEDEVAAARVAGCRIAPLGPFTLRGETAAIIAGFITQNSYVTH